MVIKKESPVCCMRLCVYIFLYLAYVVVHFKPLSVDSFAFIAKCSPGFCLYLLLLAVVNFIFRDFFLSSPHHCYEMNTREYFCNQWNDTKQRRKQTKTKLYEKKTEPKPKQMQTDLIFNRSEWRTEFVISRNCIRSAPLKR